MRSEKLDKNPEASSLRGLWSDSIFLQKTGTDDFNSKLKNVQFADSHGHGWMFKNVYKKDRKGNLLDKGDRPVPRTTLTSLRRQFICRTYISKKECTAPTAISNRTATARAYLYNEPRAAVEVGCIDCHGTIKEKANGITSGPAALHRR